MVPGQGSGHQEAGKSRILGSKGQKGESCESMCANSGLLGNRWWGESFALGINRGKETDCI